MKPFLVTLLITLTAAPVCADIVVPVRTIRAKEVILPSDLRLDPSSPPGVVTSPMQLIGQEARVALYPGRPIQPGDVGPPALIERNDIVSLVFAQGGLRILAEGRALERGAAGETVRVMNLSSRATVSGQIQPDGSIEVK